MRQGRPPELHFHDQSNKYCWLFLQSCLQLSLVVDMSREIRFLALVSLRNWGSCHFFFRRGLVLIPRAHRILLHVLVPRHIHCYPFMCFRISFLVPVAFLVGYLLTITFTGEQHLCCSVYFNSTVVQCQSPGHMSDCCVFRMPS